MEWISRVKTWQLWQRTKKKLSRVAENLLNDKSSSRARTPPTVNNSKLSRLHKWIFNWDLNMECRGGGGKKLIHIPAESRAATIEWVEFSSFPISTQMKIVGGIIIKKYQLFVKLTRQAWDCPCTACRRWWWCTRWRQASPRTSVFARSSSDSTATWWWHCCRSVWFDNYSWLCRSLWARVCHLSMATASVFVQMRPWCVMLLVVAFSLWNFNSLFCFTFFRVDRRLSQCHFSLGCKSAVTEIKSLHCFCQ